MSDKQQNEETQKTELLSDLELATDEADQTTAGTTAGGGGAGKVSMRDFSFTMKVA